MPTNEISNLLLDLISDLQHPNIFWQVLALLFCLTVAWLVQRQVRGRQVEEDATRAWRVGHGGLKRLVFPLLALGLVLVARVVLKNWLHVNLLTLAIPLLGSMAAIRFVFFVLRLTFRQSAWLVSFERIFATLVWLGVALHITGFLPDLIDALEQVSFSVGKQKLNLWLLVQGLTAVAGALLLSLWIGGVIETRLMLADGLDSNLRVVFARLAKAGLILLAVMISLPWVGIDPTALSVFGGAIGVGLGFGLQKIASNYVAGFIILLERSIRIGDVITVGSDKGRITQITTRYTVIRSGAGVEALVPNESLVSNVVQNESYSDAKVRVTQAVQISYADNPETVIALLVSLAQAQPEVLTEPAPQAYLTAFADSGVNLELFYWVEDQGLNMNALRSKINLAIWRAFAEQGISIPFPQREVRVLSEKNENLGG